MCEVAILSPESYSDEEITDAAMTVYSAMGHSLGIVALNTTGGSFEYNVYKDIVPEEQEVHGFIQDHYDDTSLFFLHGRLATSGAVNEQNAHPLKMECEQCNIDMVLHNGVVRGFEQAQHAHLSQGHQYATDVDSEFIAHAFEDVPDDFGNDELAKFANQSCFVLFNDERVYIYQSGRYELQESGEMAHSHRDFGPGYGEGNVKELLLSPEGK